MSNLYGENLPLEHFEDYYSRVQDVIWLYTTRLLELKQDVILDSGFWSRVSRDEARSKAKVLGADTKLYFLDTPEAVMLKRTRKRNEDLQGSLLIDDHAFELFKKRFEPLSEDEDHVLIKQFE